MITTADLKSLHGKSVLVSSSRDIRHPPAAMRGTIEVREAGRSGTLVSLIVDFPQMFRTSAHRRTFMLDGAGVARLMALEREGAFEYLIDEELM